MKLSTATGVSSSFFVGSAVDDAGLNVYQFRILGHLVRRAGSDGRAWPSVASIAETCGVGERVVRRTLSELVKLGLIQARPRPGRSTLYTPTIGQTPLANEQGAPLANQPDEGIPEKEIQTTTQEPEIPLERSKTPPEKPRKHVVVGCSASRETVQKPNLEQLEGNQKALADTLSEFGIIGAKRQTLTLAGLTEKEVRRTCREVRESGGRAGAMILRLEDLADRKTRGKVSPLASWTPAQPLPEPVDTVSEDERERMAGKLRALRLAM